MFFIEKWMIFALAAAILWGASYAASGLLLRSSITPLVFYFCFSWLGALIATITFFLRGEKNNFISQLKELPPAHAGWFLFSLITASIGAWMTYQAVGAKNASLASMIEISYPLFVVIFTWLFFQEFQLNTMTCLGAFFVIFGVMLILRYAP